MIVQPLQRSRMAGRMFSREKRISTGSGPNGRLASLVDIGLFGWVPQKRVDFQWLKTNADLLLNQNQRGRRGRPSQ
jgi:hypothetical protein